jgi:hypothetical protein
VSKTETTKHYEIQKRMRSGGVTLWLDWGSRAGLVGARFLLKERMHLEPDAKFRIVHVTTIKEPVK